MRTSLLYLLLILTSTESLLAGGPLNVRNGNPVTYRTTSPIPYHTDKGPLGQFSNAVARNLAITSFQVWQDVPTAVITFQNMGELPVDVDSTNYNTYLSKFSFNDGINPVVFDTDGSIIRALFGVGSDNSILGFAGSAISTSDVNAGYYSEGQVVINGKLTRYFNEGQYKGTVIHEIGHFIGLDHTQIHIPFANDGRTDNDQYIPTMYPTSTDDDTHLGTLEADDIAAVSSLYPSSLFASATGRLRGKVLRFDGSPVRGANVVAIKTNDSLKTQYSTVSDYRKLNSGEYLFEGMAPGSYWIKIEPIYPLFTEGSSVGPYASNLNDWSFISPVLVEYYNGANESSDPAKDNPQERTPVDVLANSIVNNIDVYANTEPATPILSLIEYHKEPKYVLQLPSAYDDKRYAVRFTPGTTAKLLRTEIRLNGAQKSVQGNGSLKVTVHQNGVGSFGKIPGIQYNGEVIRPFNTFEIGKYNPIDLTPLNLTIGQGSDFHIVFEVIGSVGDTIEFVMDDGLSPTDRSSLYYDDLRGVGPQWYNFVDRRSGYDKGHNIVVRAIIDIQTTVSDIAENIPSVFALHQNYPNPFNPSTTIRFELPVQSSFSLKLYDLLGRYVETIVEGERMAGVHIVPFHSRNLPSGVYYYMLEAAGKQIVKPMTIIK